MKEYIKKFICIMLVATMGLFLMSCGNKSEEAEEAIEESTDVTIDDIVEMEESENENYDNGIYFDEEMDGAEVVTQKRNAEDFVGSWEAPSGQAKYQFGNLDITVNSDGTWRGNITGEDFEGKWKEDGDGIQLTSEIFVCSLAFTDQGTLIMHYDPEDDSGMIVTTVLTKKQ